jgi:hypothetical protein
MDLRRGPERADHRRQISVRLLGAVALALGACADDPVYVEPTPLSVESDPALEEGMLPAMSSVRVPIRLEDEQERLGREALAEELGLSGDQVPSARRDDTDLQIEWTVTNLEEEEGIARLHVLAANEYGRYDPMQFVEDPLEESPPPPLLGGEPMIVPPLGVVTGVFREDELRDAAQDMDAIGRAAITPEFALLTRWPTHEVTGGAEPLVTIPSRAVSLILQLDAGLFANRRMRLEIVLRVRDRGGRLVDFDTPTGDLVAPSDAVFVPAPVVETP